jgi:hypothetical protein
MWRLGFVDPKLTFASALLIRRDIAQKQPLKK